MRSQYNLDMRLYVADTQIYIRTSGNISDEIATKPAQSCTATKRWKHRIYVYYPKQLIHAFITSRIDNGNYLLHGLPISTISHIQQIQNAAAGLITHTHMFTFYHTSAAKYAMAADKNGQFQDKCVDLFELLMTLLRNILQTFYTSILHHRHCVHHLGPY